MKKNNIMAEVTYTGELHTIATHLRSGDAINTDAPVDNRGKGQAFSPTDLMATSLASCILTVMGIRAMDWEIPMTGAHATVEKHMASNPRRIQKLVVEISMPEMSLTQKQKEILEKIAHTCPISMSLHPDLEEEISITWVN